MKIRIASYNVENLFHRTAILNLPDSQQIDALLEQVRQLQQLLEQPQYDDALKDKVFRLSIVLRPYIYALILISAPMQARWGDGKRRKMAPDLGSIKAAVAVEIGSAKSYLNRRNSAANSVRIRARLSPCLTPISCVPLKLKTWTSYVISTLRCWVKRSLTSS
ncbi:hypothetical protein [Pectobacterium versatile]|uniref:hypothetical protein n=1 Tax=Pectobacterium versatile TaxID=2488639 RepID=UPI001CC6A662